jgi:hypothetical protein
LTFSRLTARLRRPPASRRRLNAVTLALIGENLETKVRAHCNECGGERTHSILHSETTSWSDNDDGTSGSETYEMLRCLGCDNIKLRHTSSFSEDENPTINYFPPSIFRKQPEWLNELFANVAGSEEAFVYSLLLEIYSALQRRCQALVICYLALLC